MDRVCFSCGEPVESGGTYGGTPEITCFRCRHRQLATMVPPEFMATVCARLNSDNLRRVLQWEPGPRGLVICGGSGLGKTRSMWELLKRHITASDFVFMSGPTSFASRMTRAYNQGTSTEWMESVALAPIVAIDDITKLKMTPRVEAELFGIIDHRISYQLPIIVTAQGNNLSGVWSSDYAEPLVRRLREFCQVVDFSA